MLILLVSVRFADVPLLSTSGALRVSSQNFFPDSVNSMFNYYNCSGGGLKSAHSSSQTQTLLFNTPKLTHWFKRHVDQGWANYPTCWPHCILKSDRGARTDGWSVLMTIVIEEKKKTNVMGYVKNICFLEIIQECI